MWPWAHAAFGYLLFAAALRLRGDGRPAGPPVLALGLGTQLPDLVDKPLAWYLHVLPHGRSFAHSLFVAVPFLLAVGWWARRRGRRGLAVGLAAGYLSHLLGDAFQPVLSGEWRHLAFLAWPLVAPPEGELEGLLAHLADVEGSPFFLFGLALTAAGLLAWHRQGRPGLAELRDLVRPATAG